MAVAAYGSLLSLFHVLDNVHYRAEVRLLHVNIKQIETLQEGINSLLEFLEVHSNRKGQTIQGLCRQISQIAFEAEEIIDVHVVHQIQLRSQGDKSDSGFLAFCEDLEKLIQKLDFFKKELSMAEDEEEKDVEAGKQHGVHFPAASGSSATSSSGDSTAVGFDEDVIQIMDRLTSDEPCLQIISIVGMGGIGKTTLAKNIFDNKLIVEKFDLRIWLTISQKYSVHEILLGVLNDGDAKHHGEKFDDVGQNVHQKLFGRRYLIVMDDVWSSEAWDDLQRFFPNNRNGSRVMVTTRLSNLATSLGPLNSYYLTFLDEGKSWNLLCQTIFAQDDCPDPELAKIGKTIARNCRGLPLEIVVVGSQLANSDMTKEYWQFVAKNIISFGDVDAYEHCMKVLYLSYNDLPIHLKLCYLCMRVYPEDAQIAASELVTQWIAEGFIKPVSGKCLEEIGKENIENLAGRNLIETRWRRRKGSEEIIACRIHDLFRDLCLRESEKEQFIYSPKTQIFRCKRPLHERGICFHCGGVAGHGARELSESVVISASASQAHHFVCRYCEMLYSHLPSPRLLENFILLFSESNYRILQPTRLQYANVPGNELKFVSPSMFHLLWNLKKLDISRIREFSSFGMKNPKPIALPPEFWEMPQLRHIRSSKFHVVLPDPINTQAVMDENLILKNLQTLENVLDFKCTKEILNRIPNLKRLGIKYTRQQEYIPLNITQIRTLEVLRIENASLKDAIFPSSLKELVLKKCNFQWDDMTLIGRLPNLEVLHLYYCGKGREWVPVEGEFIQLIELKISDVDLVWWRAEQIHFPKLEVLEFWYLLSLKEIPLGIGDIATLHTIELGYCSKSASISALEIREEQESMGNESLQIYLFP